MTDDKPGEIEILRQRLDATNDALDRLEAENGELKERVAELEDLIHADLKELEYNQLAKKDKVRSIQREIADRASKNGGKAAMTYKDVKWHFDGQPSAGHAYDLMKLAAEAQGFDYEERSKNRPNRLTVKLDAVKPEAGFHAANKPSAETTP